MDDRLLSGFMNHDYILTFSIADERRRQALVELCRGPWMGDEVTCDTWEISNDLGPDALEKTVIGVIGDGDRVAYYYLTPPMESGLSAAPPQKRIFRVVIA